MSYTIKYLFIALLWTPLFAASLVPVHGDFQSQNTGVNSLIWVAGFSLIFYFWARNDVIIYDKGKNSIIWFALGWFILPILIVVPYLFYSRGKVLGALDTFKFFIICFGLFIGTGLLLKLL